MENIILKIIASVISATTYTAISLSAFVILQFVVYQLFGISIVNKLMKLVEYASKVEIGGNRNE